MVRGVDAFRSFCTSICNDFLDSAPDLTHIRRYADIRTIVEGAFIQQNRKLPDLEKLRKEYNRSQKECVSINSDYAVSNYNVVEEEQDELPGSMGITEDHVSDTNSGGVPIESPSQKLLIKKGHRKTKTYNIENELDVKDTFRSIDILKSIVGKVGPFISLIGVVRGIQTGFVRRAGAGIAAEKVYMHICRDWSTSASILATVNMLSAGLILLTITDLVGSTLAEALHQYKNREYDDPDKTWFGCVVDASHIKEYQFCVGAWTKALASISLLVTGAYCDSAGASIMSAAALGLCISGGSSFGSDALSLISTISGVAFGLVSTWTVSDFVYVCQSEASTINAIVIAGGICAAAYIAVKSMQVYFMDDTREASESAAVSYCDRSNPPKNIYHIPANLPEGEAKALVAQWSDPLYKFR